jgi:hypothetical protein
VWIRAQQERKALGYVTSVAPPNDLKSLKSQTRRVEKRGRKAKESLSEETVARGKGLAMAMGRTVAVNCAFLYFSLRACSLLAVIAMVK